MQPTFHTGDRVLVRRTSLEAIRLGAVVVVEQPIIGLASEVYEQRASVNGLDRNWMIKRAAAVPGTPVPEELATAPTAAMTPGLAATSPRQVCSASRSGRSAAPRRTAPADSCVVIARTA